MKKQNIDIILASASPRRKQLLESCGFKTSIIVPNIEEKIKENELAPDYALRNAKEKGLKVSLAAAENRFIISADTIVVTKEGLILEKPIDADHAKKNASSTLLQYTRCLHCIRYSYE